MRRALTMTFSLIIAAVTLLVVDAAHAQIPADQQLATARLLLPEGARQDVDFILPSADGDVVHETGGGEWICRGDRPGDDRLNLSCYTRSVAPFLDRQRELISQDIRGAAMRELLDQEAKASELQLPAYGLEISASGTLGKGGTLPEEMSVYYLLYIPFATAASIGVSDVAPDDPTVPYLHQAGTHESHVMWLKTVKLSASQY